MVELAGSLCNQEAPVRWRDLAPKHGELLKRPSRSSDAPATPAEPRTRPTGWIWRRLHEVITAAEGPVTPREAHTVLETRLGEPIPYSTIKSCMSNHVRAGHLCRIDRGRYVLVTPDGTRDEEVGA